MLCQLYNQVPCTYVSYKRKYNVQLKRKVELYKRLKSSLEKLEYKIIQRRSVVTVYRHYSFFDDYRVISETDGLSETINQFKFILHQHK